MVNYNGDLYDAKDFALPHDNRAFRYGDGFFETIRCISGQPLWMDRHIQRISESLKILKMDLLDLEKHKLTNLIAELLLSNGHIDGARARITFYRGRGGLYKPLSSERHFLIETAPLEERSYKLNNQGKLIDIFPDLFKTPNVLSPIKSLNAQLYVMAAIFASENNIDDCIIANTNGAIAEGISSNLFLAKKETIYTPSIDQGCVNGVMRNIIIEIAREAGFQVVECQLSESDLLDADELFLTNAIQGIQWVKGFQKKRYFHKISELLAGLLIKKSESLLVN